MADYPRPGNQDRTIRSHGEQIRRLRTNRGVSAEAITFRFGDGTDGDGQLNNAAGWYTNGYPAPYLIRQGGVVSFHGQFVYSPGSPPHSTRYAIVSPGVIPVEFLPPESNGWVSMLGFDHLYQEVPTLWDINVSSADSPVPAGLDNGAVWVGERNRPGSPAPAYPYIDMDDGEEHGVTVMASWAAADTGLGVYPA